ncbi:hypothetical protein BGY98DRAFT_1036734, partial [Russula aff. rugulosa BPL654]
PARDTVSEFGDGDDEQHGDKAMGYPDVYSEDDCRKDAELYEIVQRLRRLRRFEATIKVRLVPRKTSRSHFGNAPRTT